MGILVDGQWQGVWQAAAPKDGKFVRSESQFRNWLTADSRDSAKRFATPVIQAWGLDHVLIGQEADKPRLAEYYQQCVDQQRAGAVLLAEGSG